MISRAIGMDFSEVQVRTGFQPVEDKFVCLSFLPMPIWIP